MPFQSNINKKNIIAEIQIKLLHFLQRITFSKSFFFHPLLLNGTN